jgi:LCP family protein required for cell wall assembly
MPDTPGQVAPEIVIEPTVTEPPGPIRPGPIRRQRGLRVALLSVATVIVLLGGAAAASFAYVNHEVGSIPRIPVSFTAATSGTSGAVTVLLTGYQLGPTAWNPSQAKSAGSNPQGQTSDGSGLIMLLHLNADHKGGGVVSIPPQTEVQVPGHGQMQLWDALAAGGPSLVVRTVQSLTGVHINHYARVNFNDVAGTINALGGVSVDVPQATTAFGVRFPAGADQLNGTTAMAYARQLNLTEAQRVQRQQALLRAILTRVSSHDLLTNPVTMMRVVGSFTKTLTVDSSFSSAQIESLAAEMGSLKPGSAAYVTAPVTVNGTEPVITPDNATTGTETLAQPEASQLWTAIRQDSIIEFAKRYPATVTPGAIG